MLSEQELEKKLIEELEIYGYKYEPNIKTIEELNKNFIKQLEILNNKKFSEQDINKIFTYLNRGDIFDRSVILREQTNFKLENGEYIYFFNKDFCKNNFQVINQFQVNDQKNQRYDVTILINGFPLVQIELKKSSVDLNNAFKQSHRYKMYFQGLFKFVQIFIISNKEKTRYFATNNRGYEDPINDPKFAFVWTDKENNIINDLLNDTNQKESFVKSFLKPCKLIKVIFKYMVIQKKDKLIKVLRPYQYYAIQEILNKVKNNSGNGYVWHTTGSGKTLTSFKTVQLIKDDIKEVKKILFVVDRNDLDSQTSDEFNDFSTYENEIETIKTTNDLRIKILSENTNIIVTTIQKLNKLLKDDENENHWIKNERIVIVFDEAHRSQSGEISSRINNYFKNLQIFGFTGTPIFEKNKINNRTTNEVFGDCLHKYNLYNAISDKNVLPFSIEYFKTFDLKQDAKINLANEDEKIIEDQKLNKKEIWNDLRRLELITKNIFEIHSKKTHNKQFNALFVVQDIDRLIKYYDLFKKINNTKKDEEKLNISAIFSLNHEDNYYEQDKALKRENIEIKLKEEIVYDFNKITDSKVDIKNNDWYNIFRLKLINNFKNTSLKNNLDIVIVVGMLTTGFDSKILNTVYIDKNLSQLHSLIQTFSRTNRIFNTTKDAGQIVSYVPIKDKVEQSIELFSSSDNSEFVLKKSYQEYLDIFNNQINDILSKYQIVDSIISTRDIETKQQFVKEFKQSLVSLNMLKSFTLFDYNDLNIDKEKLSDFENIYSVFYREQKEDKEQISGLDQIDFKIELLSKEKIDALYISKKLKELNKEEFKQNSQTNLENYINGLQKLNENLEKSFLNKNLIDLIVDFINENIIKMKNTNIINEVTINDLYLNLQKKRNEMISNLIKEENLIEEYIINILNGYEINGIINKKELNSSLNAKGRERIAKKNRVKDSIISIFESTQI